MTNWPALLVTTPLAAADQPVRATSLERYYPIEGGTPLGGDLDFGGYNAPNLHKFWSDNWDGTIPPDLSGGEDSAATQGVAYDGLAGAIQAIQFYGAISPPTGGGAMWFTATPPAGWVLMDGTSYDKTNSLYTPLFNVIGYDYGGAGNNFNVPDARGFFLFGKATSGTGSTLGGTFGAIDHTHTGPSHTHAGGGHTHSFSDTSGGPSSLSSHYDGAFLGSHASSTHTHFVSGTTGSGSATTGSGGTGATGSNNPPGLAVHFIIKL